MIGNTPIVQIYKKGDVEAWIKLEGYNPSGSIKDIAANQMIKDAEEQGFLKGRILLEATSGNTGISLAMICAVKGYKLTLVMPENSSLERIKIMKAFGAKIILTPSSEGIDGSIRRARELSKKDEYYWLNQYDNESNWKGHYNITGKEIWKQTRGRITHFVAGIGTGGTVMGAGRRLKEYNSVIKVIGLEPVPKHKITGLKNMSESINPKIFKRKELDEVMIVNDKDAINGARWLAKNHGLLVGFSSGAAVTASLRLAKRLDKGVIVAISPDSGFKYLSTQLFRKKRKK
ncbi:MAG: cysteine synthase family protein [Nanoarchaeota archaeon]|nr:cysteine synthase family protein [Nanoarchaeota archaeon]